MKTKKNKFLTLLSFTMIFTLIAVVAAPTKSSAATTSRSYIENGFYIEEILTVYPDRDNSEISTFSSGQTKTASKTYTIKSDAGKTIGSYTLTGTFTYGTGAPAKCTSATYSTSVNDSHSKFTAKSAYSSGNQAIGAFTFTTTVNGATQTFSETLKITCSVNGNIS